MNIPIPLWGTPWERTSTGTQNGCASLEHLSTSLFGMNRMAQNFMTIREILRKIGTELMIQITRRLGWFSVSSYMLGGGPPTKFWKKKESSAIDESEKKTCKKCTCTYMCGNSTEKQRSFCYCWTVLESKWKNCQFLLCVCQILLKQIAEKKRHPKTATWQLLPLREEWEAAE